MAEDKIKEAQKEFLANIALSNYFSHCIREIVEERETLEISLRGEDDCFWGGLKLTPDEVTEALFETEHDRQRYKVTTDKKKVQVYVRLRKGIKPITD